MNPPLGILLYPVMVLQYSIDAGAQYNVIPVKSLENKSPKPTLNQ